MFRYVAVSLISGILFGVLDGLLNANPLAQKLYACMKPVARDKINVPAGFLIDLIYGFAMAGIFLLLYPGLPGAAGLVKGVSFAALAWFFRVAMSAASQWMMFKVPFKAVVYSLAAGLGEMLILGALYGLSLRP